jgi:hypothetical protein
LESLTQVFLYNKDSIRKKKHFYNLNCLAQCSVSHVASTTTSIITSGGIYQQTNLHHLPNTVVGATVKHKSKEIYIRSVLSMQQMPRVSQQEEALHYLQPAERSSKKLHDMPPKQPLLFDLLSRLKAL